MELERFEKAFSELTDFLEEKGFYREPNRFELDVYGKITDYWLEAIIITERLEEDIANSKSYTKYVFNSLRDGKDIDNEESQKSILNHMKLRVDLTDFFIHTRLFLDALTVGVKLSFLKAGNKNANNMEHSLSCLLNSKLLTYKSKIDMQFFTGLERHLNWISTLRDSRDGLVHFYHYLVFTDTKQGELGFDIMDRNKIEWGTNTVKSIIGEVQTVINNISELMEYLSNNLPQEKLKTVNR